MDRNELIALVAGILVVCLFGGGLFYLMSSSIKSGQEKKTKAIAEIIVKFAEKDKELELCKQELKLIKENLEE